MRKPVIAATAAAAAGAVLLLLLTGSNPSPDPTSWPNPTDIRTPRSTGPAPQVEQLQPGLWVDPSQRGPVANPDLDWTSDQVQQAFTAATAIATQTFTWPQAFLSPPQDWPKGSLEAMSQHMTAAAADRWITATRTPRAVTGNLEAVNDLLLIPSGELTPGQVQWAGPAIIDPTITAMAHIRGQPNSLNGEPTLAFQLTISGTGVHRNPDTGDVTFQPFTRDIRYDLVPATVQHRDPTANGNRAWLLDAWTANDTYLGTPTTVPATAITGMYWPS